MLLIYMECTLDLMLQQGMNLNNLIAEGEVCKLEDKKIVYLKINNVIN